MLNLSGSVYRTKFHSKWVVFSFIFILGQNKRQIQLNFLFSLLTASSSLDEYTEAVTSYISFCEDSCVPSRTKVSYNNDKPWFTVKLKKSKLEKAEAFRSGDRDRYVESKYRFRKEVRDAKLLYSEKRQHQFSANDSGSVWKGLITNC